MRHCWWVGGINRGYADQGNIANESKVDDGVNEEKVDPGLVSKHLFFAADEIVVGRRKF